MTNQTRYSAPRKVGVALIALMFLAVGSACPSGSKLPVPVPDIPTGLSPNNAFQTVTPFRALTWEHAPNAAEYIVAWDTSAAFANPTTVVVTETTFEPSEPWRLGEGYYWTVTSRNETGTSAASAVARFVVATPATPVNGAGTPGVGLAGYLWFIDLADTVVSGDTMPLFHVLLADATGQAVAQAGSVTVAIAAGQATVSGSTTEALVTGNAPFTGVIVDGQGVVGLSATMPGFTEALSDDLTVTPPPPTAPPNAVGDWGVGTGAYWGYFLWFTNVPATGTPGTALSTFAVGVYDDQGQPYSTATGVVVLTTTNAAVDLLGTTSLSLVNGIAVCDDVRPDAQGVFSLRADLADFTQATSGAINTTQVTPPAGAVGTPGLTLAGMNIWFINIPTTGTGGAPLTVFQVAIADNDGIVDLTYSAGIVLQLDPNSAGTGTLGGETSLNATAGLATFDNVYIIGQGDFQLIATVQFAPIQAISPTITITGGLVGDPQRPSATPNAQGIPGYGDGGLSGTFLWFVVPDTTTTSDAVIPTFNVEAYDLDGVFSNGVGGFDVVLDVANGSAQLSGTTSVPMIGGLAVFNDIVLTGGGTVMLKATAVEVGPAFSPPFNVADGAGLNSGGGHWANLPPVAAPDAPTARQYPLATWIDGRFLVWGGTDGITGPVATGSTFDPGSATWTALPSFNAPQDAGHVGFTPIVNTGRQALIWSGGWRYSSGGTTYIAARDEGHRFDAQLDRWLPIANTFATFIPRFGAGGVWTGREAIYWGGFGNDPVNGWVELADGQAFDPITDTWRTIAASPLDARLEPLVLWTGDAMLVWGGYTWAGTYFNDGALYDPDTDTWTPITSPTAGMAAGRTSMAWAWSGDELVFWGGWTGAARLDDGAAYDVDRDTWRALSPSPLSARNAVATGWLAGGMVVWSGYDGTTLPEDGALYDPVTDTWLALNAGILTGRNVAAVASDGQQLAIFSGVELIGGAGYLAVDGAVLTP